MRIEITRKDVWMVGGVPYTTFLTFKEEEGSECKIIIDHINNTFCGIKKVGEDAVVYAGKTFNLPTEIKDVLNIKPQFYITTYRAMCGWKSVMDGPDGVQETGICGWDTEDEAIVEAKQWAEDEELPYIARVGVEE